VIRKRLCRTMDWVYTSSLITNGSSADWQCISRPMRLLVAGRGEVPTCRLSMSVRESGSMSAVCMMPNDNIKKMYITEKSAEV
jgi:hypothetical protein